MSDVHLSDKPPVFRSAEPDWFAAMRRPLDEVKALQEKYDAPVVVCGDVFHRWNPSPKLINFAITSLPNCYAVPGQHDLPAHRYDDVTHSAYWTLCEAGRIINLEPGLPRPIQGCVLHGFPWGHEPSPVENYPLLDGFHVAVVHQYVWVKDCSYPDAPQESHLACFRKRLGGFRVAIVGDNHLGFYSPSSEAVSVWNNGALMRRNSDQRDYRPRVGLLRRSGAMDVHYLDCSQDRCLEEVTQADRKVEQADFSEFLAQLSGLQARTADFKETVYQTARAAGAGPGALAYVRKALGD